MTRSSRDSWWFAFVAGGLGDASACLVSHPMDVTKVRLQLKGEMSPQRQPTGIMNIMSTLKSIFLKEGLSGGVYNGLSAAILRQMIFSSLRHGSFALVTTRWSELYPSVPMSLSYQVLAGACIGGICAAIANPCDVILIRMQADGHWPPELRRNYKNIFDGLYRVSYEEGYRRLWRGCLPTVVRGILVTCSQLPAYHTAKWYLLNAGCSNNTTTHFMASVISAGVASVVTCPADVVKTRMMNMKNTSITLEYSSSLDCAIKTVKTEGIRGLYKGLGSTFARLGPHCVILWIMQEQILNFLRKTNK